MNKFSKVTIWITGGLAALAGIGWAGLRVTPPNLPAPVRRYFQAAFGEQAPRVESLVVVGRAKALCDDCIEILGLQKERLNVEFTQHAGNEMYHPALGGWSPEWSGDET